MSASLCRTELHRTAFTTSRALEFFSESELTTQFGYERTLWPLIIVKELADNALDEAESLDLIPVISVELQPDAVIVSDNGPGIPAEIIEKSLDYQIRVSDKKHYIAPTRGQLGNALKCLWAAPFVAFGDKAHAEVIGRGLRHDIDVSLDRINQQPGIKLSTRKLRSVKNSSSVQIDWKGISSSELEDYAADFYQFGDFSSQLVELIHNFALFNPHAEFRLKLPGKKLITIKASNRSWSKWRKCDPTSPHWYGPEHLRALIAAYVSTGEHKTLRDFVREFAGLSGTQVAKRVLAKAKLSDLQLADLVSRGDIDIQRVARLLNAMKAESRPIQPKRLGVIGAEHFTRHASMVGLLPQTMSYKKIAGFDGDLPFVVEVGFGLRKQGGRHFVCGLNNSAVFKIPTDDLSDAIGQARIYPGDSVILQVHICSPRFEFLDHGKGSFVAGTEIGEALAKAIDLTTRDFVRAKRKAAAAHRDELSPEQIEKLHAKKEKQSIRETAFSFMADAYVKASDNGLLPADKRQIMYCCRDLVLNAIGKCWSHSAYFTQNLLPQYIRLNPDETTAWDIVADGRGTFREPHGGESFSIGTLEVRDYLRRKSGTDLTHCFGHALYIEKEGFDQILGRAQIADRYDIAIIGGKGQSVIAARTLVAALSDAGVIILGAHDFDLYGISICHWLSHSNERHTFKTTPHVIDIGLRLADVQNMRLQSEPMEYQQEKDPRELLRTFEGVTTAEQNFLVEGPNPGGKSWRGQRVELNAMPGRQLIDWLEKKFELHGVAKVIPGDEVLGPLWQSSRAASAYAEFAREREAEIRKDFEEQYQRPKTPADLRRQVQDYLTSEPIFTWGNAVSALAFQDAAKKKT